MIYTGGDEIKVIHGNTEEMVDYINKDDCPMEGDYIKTSSGTYIVEKTLYDFVEKIKVLYCSESYDLVNEGYAEAKPIVIRNFILKRNQETISKLQIIKDVKETFNLGLKEAKDYVDSVIY